MQVQHLNWNAKQIVYYIRYRLRIGPAVSEIASVLAVKAISIKAMRSRGEYHKYGTYAIARTTVEILQAIH